MARGQKIDLDRLLRERIAEHVPGSVIDGDVVRLGDTGICISTEIGGVQDMGRLHAVSLFYRVWGGPFGRTPSFASMSGYHADPAGAVIEGSCLWVCTLLDVLAAAGLARVAGRPADDRVTSTQVEVAGRPFRLVTEGVDRCLGFGPDAEVPARVAAARDELHGLTMSEAVVAAGGLPVLAGPDVVLLSCYAGRTTSGVTPEVKVHGGDWPPALGPIAALQPEPEGAMTMLREISVLIPLAPARLERDSLQRALDDIGRHRSDHPSGSAGWGGWRHHQGRLAPPLPLAAVARVVPPERLPADYVRFMTEVAGGGAGPGYGVVPPVIADGDLVLAHAGCGIRWLLRPDGVWVDRCDGEAPTRTDASFTDWYGRWLDASYAGEPFADWDRFQCANIGVLAQVLDDTPQIAPNSIVVRQQPPPGRPARACQQCVVTFDQFGQDEAHAFGG